MADFSLRADSARINPIAIFGRKAIEAGVERLIALLDQVDGDPDLEGDEPPESNGDEADTSWTEWHTRGRHKLDPGIYDCDGYDLHEDAETDGDEEDGSRAEDEPCAMFRDPKFLRWLGGPGCELADPGGDEHDGRELCGVEFQKEGWGAPGIASN
jgi:hypothetical protein